MGYAGITGYVVLAVVVVSNANVAIVADDDPAREAYEFWRRAPSDLSLYPNLPIGMALSRDEACREDSRRLIDALKNQTTWAMQMWDASTTAGFGILFGNKYNLGSYDECLLVREPIRAHYCNVKIRATVHNPDAFVGDPYELDPPPNSTVWKKFQDSRRDHSKYFRDETHWGLCVPASCNRFEVAEGINEYLKHLNEERILTNGTTYHVEIPEDYCVDGSDEDATPGEIGFWTFAVLLVAVVVVATSVDSPHADPDAESRSRRLLMCFSLRRNIPRLGRNDDAESSHLDFLHGIKVVTIVFIVLDHHAMFSLAAAIVNKQDMEMTLRSWQNMFIPSADLLVDTCFFIGGVLVTHLYLEHTGRVNPLFVICLRLFRLAPLYFFIIWFQATAIGRFGSGPAWKFGLRDEIRFCQKNWWANLLFIQNYVNPEEMCMLHAWYLPCDFHFFIVAVLVTTIIKRNRAVGVALLYVITLVSIVTPGIITYVYELNPTVEFQPAFLDKPRLDQTFQLLYVKSHTRICVYLLGMITAYHLHRNRKSTWRIPNIVSVLGCFLGLGLLFAPMAYGGPTYYNPRRTYDVIGASIFASVRRLLWGLAWVLFLFINRFGVIPIFGNVFSWRISVPLSKTTYAVYLIHFILQITDQAKVRIPYQFVPFDMFVKGTNDLFFSVGYAFVLYLVLELPFRLIFKELILSPSKKRKVKQQVEADRSPALTTGSITTISTTLEDGKIESVKL